MGVITEQILRATDSSLAKPDKDLVSKILTYLEKHPECYPEAINTLKERFEVPDVKVQMLNLFLVDKSMKKLGNNFFDYIGTKDFMNTFVVILADDDTVPQLK